MSTKDKMVWDGAADQKLFLTILTLHEIKVDNDKVAAAFGPPCNAKAIKNRIGKLKIMAKEQNIVNSGNSDSGPSNTPKKAATKGKGDSSKFPGAKKVKKSPAGDTDEGNGSNEDAATSNKKTAKVAKKGGVSNKRKKFADDDGDDGNTHKKTKTEEEGSVDNQAISEADPASD